MRPRLTASSGVSVSLFSSASPSASAFDFAAKDAALFAADAACGDTERREALVGVVGAKREAVLGAAGEHAIGLGDAARDEIVDHHAEIAVGARDDERIACARRRARGIDAGKHPLPRCFLIAGGAVDLPGEKQPRHRLDLEARRQLARIDIVVFDGVAGTLHARLLQPRDGGEEGELHIFGERGRDAVRIDGVVVETFRLEEDLVPLALLEAHHLVFDRRAIARADASGCRRSTSARGRGSRR